MRFDNKLLITLLPLVVACSSGTGSGNGNGTGANGNGTGANGNGLSGAGNGAAGAAASGNGGSANGTGSGGSANGTGSGGSANGTGSGGSANGTGSGGAGGACTNFNAGATAVPPVLLFLVDNSGSMDNPPTGAGQGADTKWVQTRDALINAFGGFPDDWAVGMTFFPNGGGRGSCFNARMQVPIRPLCDNRQALTTALNGTNPGGGTPTPLAMNYALGQVNRPASSANCPADYSQSPLYVVLMTDGTPTYNLQCAGIVPIQLEEYQAMIDAVATAATGTPSVGTFVIGVPGSEVCDPTGGDCCTGNNCGTGTYNPRNMLSQMATSGGTSTLIHPTGCSDTGPTYCHIDLSASGANLGTALQSALGQIGSAVASCTYTAPQAPTGYVLLPEDVHVNYNGTELTHQPDAPAACTSGWQYSADQTQILLCGTTCDTVQADTQAAIRVWATCLQPG